MMRNRRLLTAAAAGMALVAIANSHPTASIRLLTHDLTDPAPRRMQAAIDLGLVGVSILYTWTVRSMR